MRESKCPFCSALLLVEDERRRVSHEVPQCDEFTAFLGRVPGPVKTELTLSVEGGPLRSMGACDAKGVLARGGGSYDVGPDGYTPTRRPS
jgi:hypothetical protein